LKIAVYFVEFLDSSINKIKFFIALLKLFHLNF